METTAVTPQYTTQKYGRQWNALRDGVAVTSDHYSPHVLTFGTRKEAELFCVTHAANMERDALETAQDASGNYVWSATEEKEIAEYVTRLYANESRRTFTGVQTLQETARKQHVDDAKMLRHHVDFALAFNTVPTEWSKGVSRRIRRVMAARAETFKRAGLAL